MIDRMAFVGQKPWHGFGSELTEGASLAQWRQEAWNRGLALIGGDMRQTAVTTMEVDLLRGPVRSKVI